MNECNENLNPPCYTPKCETCPFKDSCKNYYPPVRYIPTPYIPYMPYYMPYYIGDPPQYLQTTITCSNKGFNLMNEFNEQQDEPPSEMGNPSRSGYSDNLDFLASQFLRRDIVLRRRYKPSVGLPVRSGSVKCGVLSHFVDYFLETTS